MPKIPIAELKKNIVIKAKLHGLNFTFNTTWGLFSPEKIDEGTGMLINAINPKENDIILDLGCGYGAIGVALAKLAPKGKVHMTDKDFVAVEYAKKNAELNNVTNTLSYLSNGFDQIPKETKFDKSLAGTTALPFFIILTKIQNFIAASKSVELKLKKLSSVLIKTLSKIGKDRFFPTILSTTHSPFFKFSFKTVIFIFI